MVRTPRFRNKRGEPDTFGLSASDAYEWHRTCPCQHRRPQYWVQIQGRGDQGAWAAAWLDWLSRTHLEPQGFPVVKRPSHRLIDVHLAADTTTHDLISAVRAGNLTTEDPPEPPPDLWDTRNTSS